MRGLTGRLIAAANGMAAGRDAAMEARYRAQIQHLEAELEREKARADYFKNLYENEKTKSD